jgi:uncharacterized protein YdeI (BOF family)
MRNDFPVTVRGNISQLVNAREGGGGVRYWYALTDSTGTIEFNFLHTQWDSVWMGQSVAESDTVEVSGLIQVLRNQYRPDDPNFFTAFRILKQ